MGVCYVSKKQTIVVNTNAKKDSIDSIPNSKSNLILIKTKQLIEFKNKVRQTYYSNTFRSIPIQSFMIILEETQKENTIGEKLTYLFNKFSFTDIEKGLTYDIIKMSSNKLSLIFPDSEKFRIMFEMIYFLLSKRNTENDRQRYEFSNKLINYALIPIEIDEGSQDERKEIIQNIYSTKKMTLIVINTLLFLSYFILYFFFLPNIFEVFFNLKEEELRQLLVDKNDVKNIKQKKIEQTVFHIVKLMNPYFSRNLFMLHSIYSICSPLKELIINRPTQKIFELDENNRHNFNEFLGKIKEIFSVDNIIELMLNAETKEI